MDWKALLQTILTYGKGPACRAIVWILVTWLGSKGVTAAEAGDVANTVWPSITAIVMAIASLVWSAQSDKTLHNSQPPQS